MDNIRVLEEIGLKKVCDETHIEQKYLKYMIENDYDKLDHINTLGFVKILSREYKIDLSAWQEAFEEYWVENRKDEEDDGLFIVVKDDNRSRKLMIFLFVVLLGVTVSILFSIFQDRVNLSNYMSNDEVTYEQPDVIEEAQKSLDEQNNSLKSSTIIDETVNEDIVVVDENVSDDNAVDENVVEKQDMNSSVKEEEPKRVEEAKKEPTEKVSPRFLQEAIIVPNSPLWIGVIYLDTKKRRSYLGEGNFSIDISREQIITTGHGSFSLDINGEKREFSRQSPIRFLVKDTNITEIKWSKFKELNEGKPW